jgi:hypothetical protein
MLGGGSRCYLSIAAGRPLELNAMELVVVADSTQVEAEVVAAAAVVVGAGREL